MSRNHKPIVFPQNADTTNKNKLTTPTTTRLRTTTSRKAWKPMLPSASGYIPGLLHPYGIPNSGKVPNPLPQQTKTLPKVTKTAVKTPAGESGTATWTFYGGHDPEDYQHLVGDPVTELDLHKQSPGYRLILNNVLFPAAKKKQHKT